eukprot:CAMPEP_0172703106 /NCGR_PEP_ID=MMETSP1074-20121228/36993_1 /TAXON_ID=2916 /ORGANISM="Ceratium fusus, Strain PA161109" /LENGTH=64 /DNA_ID=CAMNT_0013524959 /DNA_START=33 /DNA_END=227 /DNA_ORIENTATION=+
MTCAKTELRRVRNPTKITAAVLRYRSRMVPPPFTCPTPNTLFWPSDIRACCISRLAEPYIAMET